MEKSRLLEAILAALQGELALQTEAAQTSRDEATDEESRSEDKYDMRGQLAAYVAAGQAKMAGEIAEALAAYRALSSRVFVPTEPIATGALVTLEARGRQAVYFLGPVRGGLELTIDNTAVTVITAASPLGRQLAGKRVGDFVMLPGRPTPVAHRIMAVA
ncbi:MAG TPA: transcription elongation factor [Opitutaceae bacterium]